MLRASLVLASCYTPMLDGIERNPKGSRSQLESPLGFGLLLDVQVGAVARNAYY